MFTDRDILMASRAEELQRSHTMEQWDYYTNDGCVSLVEETADWYMQEQHGWAWLPRLDQLFAILKELPGRHYDGDIDILWTLSDCFEYDDPLPNIYQMMLRAWMKFNHGKDWDDASQQWVSA